MSIRTRVGKFVVAAVAVLAIGASAFAGTVKLSNPSGGYDGFEYSGGAFVITPQKVNNSLTYNGEVGGFGGTATTFLSFCLERSEQFNWNTPYTTKIETFATMGGNGATDGKDPLGSSTAWIYRTFRDASSFSDLASAFELSIAWSTDANTLLTQKRTLTSAIQYAIWDLEGELVWDVNQSKYVNPSGYSGSFSSAPNSWARQIVSEANSNAIAGNLYGVRVLQLWSGTTPIQDQLTIVPTPTAAMAGLGLIAGLAVAGYIKRRRANDRI